MKRDRFTQISEHAATPRAAVGKLTDGLQGAVEGIKASDGDIVDVVVRSVSHDVTLVPENSEETRFQATALIYYTVENKADPGY